MANSTSHAALPYPIKKARYTVFVPFLDADGDPTDPTTPDTEVSKDAGAFADCAEEVTTISGSNGSGYLTLSGAETDASLVVLCAKVASGPKATLLEVRPRVLPIVHAGTAQAGAAGTITLASGASATDDFYNGCILRTTGGTGGGGTGGANNQARVMTDYVGSTKVATIEPNWETTPSSDTTYDVLLTEVAVNAVLSPATTTPPTAAAIRTEIDSNSTQLAAIKAKTDNLPSDPADDSDIDVQLATIAGYLDTEVAAIKAKTDNLPASFPANFSSLSIDANGRVKAQTAIQKNVAFTNFLFQMTDATTHAPKTGLVNGDFTKQETIDGAAGAALSGTITEVDAGDLPGFYKIDFTAGELNGNAIGLRFAASGCDDTELTILTNA
jgi:hypothetical protein